MTRQLLILLCSFALPRSVSAWDYEGHRTINQLALTSLPPDFPEFSRTPGARDRIAFLAGEPDRWYNTPDLPLRHANGPDHFIDLEDLAPAELTPAQLSEFRHIYTGQVALARTAHPERFPKIDSDKNKDRTQELPGYLPWAIIEHFSRLKSAFSYLKAYEELGTAEEIANAQANIIYLMGVIGHFVGDGAQPLHTTKHFNGWVGENPKGYTTARTFHAWIDGGFIAKLGGLQFIELEQRVKPAIHLSTTRAVGGRDPIFEQALAYLQDNFARVEPLYALEKEGRLSPEKPDSKEGRAFLENQILSAAHMLGSLWLTAWKSAPADKYLHDQLIRRKARNPASS